MNQKRLFFFFSILVIGGLLTQPLMAQTIKVDAGHHPGSIVNDGKFSPVFTYDESVILEQSAQSGDVVLQLPNNSTTMDHLSVYQIDTYPVTFTIEGNGNSETLDIAGFDYSSNQIDLNSPVQHDYPSLSQITFNFEVQAHGCQNGSGHWVDIQYNYDMEGGTWDDDNRCSVTGASYGPIAQGGDRVGLVEYVETWKVADRVVSSLSGASHTRASQKARKTIYNRGQNILGSNADLFVSIHFNAYNRQADDSRIYPLHRTEFNDVEWYSSYNASNNTVSNEVTRIQGTYDLAKGDTFYAKITPTNPNHCSGLGTNGCHIRPCPLRTRLTDAGTQIRGNPTLDIDCRQYSVLRLRKGKHPSDVCSSPLDCFVRIPHATSSI